MLGEGSETCTDASYWDRVFYLSPDDSHSSSREWLLSYDGHKDLKRAILSILLGDILTKENIDKAASDVICCCRIILPGCGDSEMTLSLDRDIQTFLNLYLYGPQGSDKYKSMEQAIYEIQAIDLSANLITRMKQLHADTPGASGNLVWICEDFLAKKHKEQVNNIDKRNAMFTVVIDKAFLDCLFHCQNHMESIRKYWDRCFREMQSSHRAYMFIATVQPISVIQTALDDWKQHTVEHCVESKYEIYWREIMAPVDCNGLILRNPQSSSHLGEQRIVYLYLISNDVHFAGTF